MTDTPAPPVWLDPPPVPPLSSVPQDSHVEAQAMTERLLGALSQYREEIRDVLDAGAVTALAVEQAARLRREVAAVTDLVLRRHLGEATTAHRTARLAERIAGLVVAQTPEGVDPEDVLGKAYDRCAMMAAPSDEEFAAAVEACADAGGVTFAGLAGALAAGGSDVARQQQRAMIERLATAGVSDVDMAVTLGVGPDRLRELAAEYGVTVRAEPVEVVALDAGVAVPGLIEALREVGAQAFPAGALPSVEGVSTAQAADWAAELWDLCVPLLGLRKALVDRGKASA